MRKLIVAALPLLLSGCLYNPNPYGDLLGAAAIAGVLSQSDPDRRESASSLSREQLIRFERMEFREDLDPREFASLGTIKGYSCENLQAETSGSVDEDARDQLRIKAARVFAHAITNTACARTGVSEQGCVRPVVCTGEAITLRRNFTRENLAGIEGLYISEITTNSNWQFLRRYQRLRLRIKQDGDRFVATEDTFGTRISGTVESDVVRFIVEANEVSGFYEADGEWKWSAEGMRYDGFWKSRGGPDAGSGRWNLVRVE